MSVKIIAVNKSASFEYFIEDRYEAGIVLEGSEVKSIREGRASLSESFCEIRGVTQADVGIFARRNP